jgi:hypothetical protein
LFAFQPGPLTWEKRYEFRKEHAGVPVVWVSKGPFVPGFKGIATLRTPRF